MACVIYQGDLPLKLASERVSDVKRGKETDGTEKLAQLRKTLPQKIPATSRLK